MTKQKNSIPIFEDDEVKRDIYFFPEIGGAYAIRNKAVTYHSDEQGDPWSIFGPKGGHIATFCVRKSKIMIWPFKYTDEWGEAGEGVPEYVKLARRSTMESSLTNAVRFAWLKWPYSKMSGTECSVVRFGKKGCFYVPYDINKHLCREDKGSSLVFDFQGKLVGKVDRDFSYETDNKSIYKGSHKITGIWHEVVEGKGSMMSGAVVRNLLMHIEDGMK